MRQLVYTAPGRVEWQHTDPPQLYDEHSAIVEPLAVARCDLDAPMVLGGLFPGPFPVGHEIVGRVAAIGQRVSRHKVGDRVIVPYQVSCGHCATCATGTFAACHTFTAPIGASFGFGAMGGGYGGGVADQIAVPAADHLLIPAPPNLAASALAALSDNVVDGYRAVGPALSLLPDAEVLILAGSPGSIALYAAAAATAIGANAVRYVDTDPARIEAARKLGAETSLQQKPWPKRFNEAAITVAASSEPDGIAAAIRSTSPYGHCTLLTVPFEKTTPMPLLSMYTRGITIHTSRADSYRYLPNVLNLVGDGLLNPLSVPTTIRDWDEAAEAWLEPAVKLVITR